jgi:hypothetical protein
LHKNPSILLSALLKDLGYYEKQTYLKAIREMMDEQEIKLDQNEIITLLK